MNPAISNLVISLGGMQVARRLPLDDPKYIWYLRGAYILVQLWTLLVNLYLTSVIRKKNDLTVVKYVQPPSPTDPDAQPELVTTTVRDYDLAEVSKSIKGMLPGIGIMAFMHLYLKYTQPLFIQSIMGIASALQSNEAKLHIFGNAAEGNLSRPFKSGGGLMEQLTGQSSGPQTDAASIKAAEKAGGATTATKKTN